MVDIKRILAEDAALVDAELDRILSNCVDEKYPVLADAMRYSVMSGGKRIRPCLTIEVCRILNANEEMSDEQKELNIKKAVVLAAALELVHTYSLIHDDLPCMDNDDIRRGKPTNHKVYGEAMAVLAGDALLTLAFEVISDSQILNSSEKALAISQLSNAAGCKGMIGGQVLDMLGESEELPLDLHREMNARKTAYLFRVAAMLGSFVLTKACSEHVWLNVKEYAYDIGVAFQVVDDLLDDGEEDNKATYLKYMTRKEAEEYARKYTDIAIKAISHLKGNELLTELAKSLIERTF